MIEICLKSIKRTEYEQGYYPPFSMPRRRVLLRHIKPEILAEHESRLCIQRWEGAEDDEGDGEECPLAEHDEPVPAGDFLGTRREHEKAERTGDEHTEGCKLHDGRQRVRRIRDDGVL